MVFFGERFRRDDEEDIWEELRQMLLNAPSEEEQWLNKKREQEYIDKILTRAFGDEKLAVKKKPYLTIEELMEGVKEKPQINTPIAPVTKTLPQKLVKTLQVNEIIPIEELTNSVKQIKNNIENILTEENKKKAAGVGLQAAGMIPAVRGGGIVAKGAGVIGKKLAPKIGRKIAKEIGESAVTGTLSGALEGLGRGLVEDENLLKTTLQDAGIGAILGTTGGAVGGNIQKAIRGKELKTIDNLLKNKQLNKQEKSDFIKRGNKYYQDYEQGVETIVKGLGKVKLSSDGLKETVTQKPEHIVDVINLSKNLKTSKNLGVEQPKHSHKYDITTFHHLRGKNVDYQIAENSKGDKYFYKITDPYLTGPKPEGEGLLDTNKSIYNIIPPSQANLNPSKQSVQAPMTFAEWLEELKRKRRNKF